MSIPVTYWPDGALQGNIPVNDSLQSLAALGQANVEQTLNAPPTTVLADVGKMWLVGTSPSGAWLTPTNRANQLALCTAAGVWRYFSPATNVWLIWDKGTGQLKRWDLAAWVVFAEQVFRGFKNYLINGDFAINQRAFAGGALAAGVYGHDRWKAGSGGCNYTVNASTAVVTHTSGPLVQVIEAPRLASAPIFVSVEDPSGSITVNVDGQTGTITAGSGRRGVAIVVPSGSTGNVTLTLTATGVTYKRVQVEYGSLATTFEWRPAAMEMTLANRYYRKGRFATDFYTTNSSFQTIRLYFGGVMRAVPALSGVFTYTLSTANGVTDLPTIDGLRVVAQATATGNCAFICDWTADSEL